MEAWRIEQYYDFGRFLMYQLEWHKITDESGYRIFFDREDVSHFMRETNMINRILHFQLNVPLEMHILDLLYVWFQHNWAPGIAALPT